MSDIIRVDLTPEEADDLLDLVRIEAVQWGYHDGIERWHLLAKLLKAWANPLNGASFPRWMSAVDVARLEEQPVPSDAIPDDEIPW